MKFFIQRVLNSRVLVENKTVGEIGKGYLVLIGLGIGDNEAMADRMLDKLVKLRIFEDENGKTNLSIKDVGGALLLISQFTLYANCKKGNRPSFTDALGGEESEKLYNYIVDRARGLMDTVECGIFGADMKVELLNDGPFSVMLDSDVIF